MQLAEDEEVPQLAPVQPTVASPSTEMSLAEDVLPTSVALPAATNNEQMSLADAPLPVQEVVPVAAPQLNGVSLAEDVIPTQVAPVFAAPVPMQPQVALPVAPIVQPQAVVAPAAAAVPTQVLTPDGSSVPVSADQYILQDGKLFRVTPQIVVSQPAQLPQVATVAQQPQQVLLAPQTVQTVMMAQQQPAQAVPQAGPQAGPQALPQAVPQTVTYAVAPQVVQAAPLAAAAPVASVPVASLPVAAAPQPPSAIDVAAAKAKAEADAAALQAFGENIKKMTTDEALLTLFDVASQLKAVYKSFDLDGNGIVEPSEYPLHRQRRLSMDLADAEEPEQVAATVEPPPAAYLAASTATLSSLMVRSATAPPASTLSPTAATNERLHSLFVLLEKLSLVHGVFDADKDGKVSAADLVNIAKGPAAA